MRIVVVGAAGQARDTAYLIKAIRQAGTQVAFAGYVVSELSALGPHDSDVLGDEDWLDTHRKDFDGLALGIGSPKARLQVAERLAARFPRAEWPNLVHPRASMDWETSTLGRGVNICDSVIGTVNIKIDDFALLNPAVTLGHEAVVGPGCVMNHASGVSGGVVLEQGVLVGTGARVLQYLRVGEYSRVGAGAVVTKDVPSNTTCIGIPAHVMRT